PYTVTASASDGHNIGSTTFTWTIIDITTPTVTNPGAQSSNEGASVSLAIHAVDSGGDTLTYGATGLPAGLAINAATGVNSGTVCQQAADGKPFTGAVSGSDGHNIGNSNFSWTFGDTTPPVVTNPGTQNSGGGSSVSLPIPASDGDGDPLAYSAVGLPP